MNSKKRGKTKVSVDASDWTGSLRHIWNYIGYDELNYTTTPEGKETLGKFMDLPDRIYHFRPHHILCTGNCRSSFKWGSSNIYIEDEEGDPEYNYKIIDELLDTYLDYNAKPFFEIGFMPYHLSAKQDEYTLRDYHNGGWAYPPKDYDKWFNLIKNLVQHCKERYGTEEVESWYWELWNEPDIDFYWKGSIEEFCKLYDYTVAAFKAVLPNGKIGGPATTGPRHNKNSGKWLDKFLVHCVNGTNYYSNKKGTTIDYITFHVKGGGYPTTVRAEKRIPSVKRLLNQVQCGLDIINQYSTLKNLDVILSECDPDGWAAGGAWDNANLNFRNSEYYPSYVVTAFKNIIDIQEDYEGNVDALTWAFTFVGERCFEGTRSFTTRGIDKPILNLFRMFSKLGDTRLSLESTMAINPCNLKDDYGLGEDPNIDGIASINGNEKIQVLLFCHHDDWDVDGEYEVEIEIDNLPYDAEKINIKHYRIDKKS